MNVKSTLENLKDRGVTFWLEGYEIRIRGTGKPLNPELLAELKTHKPEIMQILKEEQPKPYLAKSGDLVIQFDSDPGYHWWRPGSQRSWDIREELKRLVN